MSKINLQNINTTLRRLNIEFWRFPNRLMAMRATIAMAMVSIPFVIVGKPFYGVTLALGALAGALAERDDHPKGRIKSLSITVVSFLISSLAVGLLYEMPWLLGMGFIGSTILYVLIGGISNRYRSITFGAILIGIYAMLGYNMSPDWYWQAILLPGGALVHGLISLVLLWHKPWRPLDEQLAKGFRALAAYLEAKAALFPSEEKDQKSIKNKLTFLNIGVVNALERIKEVLNSYDQELKDSEKLRPYLQRFMLLQGLHERAASTHERYDVLSSENEICEVMSGIGELLRQLGFACSQVAENMLTGMTYRFPKSADWISKAIAVKLENMDSERSQTLMLLHHNLNRSVEALKYLDNYNKGAFIPRLSKDGRTLWERLKAQFTIKHPRMRYAIRLGISFSIGFALVQYFQLEKGAWIMLTSLFVSQISYRDTRQRLFQRVVGTITGVVVGVLLIQIFPTDAGLVILMLASAMAFFYWLHVNYSNAVVFITIFVVSLFSLVSAEGTGIILPRIVYTLIGAILAYLVIRFLWPGWQHKRIPVLFAQAMESNAAYFEAIVKEYEESNPDDLEYRIARRQAHLLGNELAVSGQSMRIEPKNKQGSMQNFLKLIYLNHTLLSYISALGAHRDSNKLDFNGSGEMAGRIMGALSQIGAKGESIAADFHPLLVALRDSIVKSDSVVERQQMQLFYNIADLIVKISRELESIN